MERKHSIAFVGTYYTPFLAAHYRNHPVLLSQPYQTQLDALLASGFGDSDFYSHGIEQQGWEAVEIIANCNPLQQRWRNEHDAPLDNVPTFIHQILKFGPDVVYFHDLSLADSTVIELLRGKVRLIVGQIASPIPSNSDIRGFDLIVTSFPHFTEAFRRAGIQSLYQPLAFDSRVLCRLGPREPQYASTFIGGVSSNHQQRINILSEVCEAVQLDTWGYGYHQLSPESPILKSFHGEVWGHSMFSVLRNSHLTLNTHIDISSVYANNMRLFEATGVGTLLLTEARENLSELFYVDQEIVTYDSVQSCIDKIRYFTKNQKEANDIAAAGQARALGSHTYTARMAQTAEILRVMLTP